MELAMCVCHVVARKHQPWLWGHSVGTYYMRPISKARVKDAKGYRVSHSRKTSLYSREEEAEVREQS